MRWTVQIANEEYSGTDDLNVFSSSCFSPMFLDLRIPRNKVKRWPTDRTSVPSPSIGPFYFVCVLYSWGNRGRLWILATYLIDGSYMLLDLPLMVLYIAFSLPSSVSYWLFLYFHSSNKVKWVNITSSLDIEMTLFVCELYMWGLNNLRLKSFWKNVPSPLNTFWVPGFWTIQCNNNLLSIYVILGTPSDLSKVCPGRLLSS